MEQTPAAIRPTLSTAVPVSDRSVGQVTRLGDLPVAEAALMDLCRPFAPEGFRPECVIVQPDEIPFPQDQLLVHHNHMTEVLERHHGAPVEVRVMDERLVGNIYTRKIALNPRGSAKVVEWGLVKMDLGYMDPPVRDAILAKTLPLGAVLIKHDVLRRIKMRWFIRLPAGGPVLKLFGEGAAGKPSDPPAYGRVGTIYCNDEAAIELIEIAVNCER